MSSSSSSSRVEPKASESGQVVESVSGAVAPVEGHAVAVTSEFAVGEGASTVEKNRIPEGEVGSAAAAIAAAAGTDESAPVEVSAPAAEPVESDAAAHDGARGEAAEAQQGSALAAEADEGEDADAAGLLVEEAPLVAEVANAEVAEATAQEEAADKARPLDATGLVIEAALAEDAAGTASFGEVAGAAIAGLTVDHTADLVEAAEAAKAAGAKANGGGVIEEMIDAGSDEIMTGPPDLVVPAAPEEADFLRRVVLPSSAGDSIFTSATGAHVSGSYAAGSLPGVSMSVHEDDSESGDRTVISDPPSAELLAAMAISPSNAKPLSGWQERSGRRLQLSPLQLGGLLLVTALGGGLLGGKLGARTTTVGAGASAAMAAPEVITPQPAALTITPLPAPAPKAPEPAPVPPVRGHGVRAAASAVATPDGSAPAHTATGKHPASGIRHSKRVARREWVDPFEK